VRNHLVLPVAALLLSACSLTPDYNRPDIATPATWSQQQDQPGAADIAYDWWTSFGSEELDGLMQTALANNTDLLAGIQRVEQARASLKIAGASLLPRIDVSGGGNRSYTDFAGGGSDQATSLNAGLGIAYELDLFGANQAGVEAAQAQYEATAFNEDALSLLVMGDVATGYFTLLNLRERLAIADDNLQIARELQEIVQTRLDLGSESMLALAQQRVAVANSEAARAALIQQITSAENALAVLLGKPPGAVTVEAQTLSGTKVPGIAPGQPSSLLERRPDIRAAEATLIAANADIGAARAAFFPSISLGGTGSLASTGFGDPVTSVIALAASIAAPIFSGGANEGGLESATARQLELAQAYRGTVLTGFQEVEDALAAVRSAQDREAAYQIAMEQSREAYDLSTLQYDAGLIDFQTLLDTQSSRLSAEDSYAQSRLALLLAAIDLYKTLGGGWQSV